MLTKKKVLHLVLALTKAGDNDLLKGKSFLADQLLNFDDLDRVKEIGRIVDDLCKGYSYLNSSAYSLEIAAKSASFVNMKTKIESGPIKKIERLESLYSSIRNLVDDSIPLRELVREDQQPLVDRLVDVLGELSIPKN